MVLHGNNAGVSVDATFGINKKKACALASLFFQLYDVVVVLLRS